jgi:AAA15 family ATPase/GTPase
MLLRIEIENFLSFYKDSSFDLFPNLKRTTFPSHIYSNIDIPVLKQSVIYGANGSGKSNLLNAIDFIKEFVLNKDFINQDVINRSKFRLLESENKQPVKLGIEFKGESQYYKYKFELEINNVVERLFVSGIGKKEDELIFSRVGNTIEMKKGVSQEITNATTKLLKKNPYSSLLSLNNEFPIINDSRVKESFEWFQQNLNVLRLNRIFPSLIDMMSRNKPLLKFANNIFNNIGLGVQSLEIKSDSINKIIEEGLEDDSKKLKELLNERLESNSGIARMKNDKVLFAIVKEKEEQVIKRFVFNQLGKNGFKGKMDIEDQSDGTVKLLNLIPALFDAIEKEYTICIDEIENSIHPSLISALISYFSKSKSKGQLIFTTHETELLNQQKLMRPDEVWFAEKHEGDTKLYSLNDFKEHNTINIKNGYLEGRYGGIPFIGNLDE